MHKRIEIDMHMAYMRVFKTSMKIIFFLQDSVYRPIMIDYNNLKYSLNYTETDHMDNKYNVHCEKEALNIVVYGSVSNQSL